MTERKNKMRKPDARKSPMSEVGNYIEMLEKKVVELGNAYKEVSSELEICKRQVHITKEKERLSNLWARGQIEN